MGKKGSKSDKMVAKRRLKQEKVTSLLLPPFRGTLTHPAANGVWQRSLVKATKNMTQTFEKLTKK